MIFRNVIVPKAYEVKVLLLQRHVYCPIPQMLNSLISCSTAST